MTYLSKYGIKFQKLSIRYALVGSFECACTPMSTNINSKNDQSIQNSSSSYLQSL
jgi:hypothetical protein